MVLPVTAEMPPSALAALDARLRSLMGGPTVVDGPARLSIVPVATPDVVAARSNRWQRWVLARTTEAPRDVPPVPPPGAGRYRWVCPLCPTLPTRPPPLAYDLAEHVRREHPEHRMLVCGLCTGTEMVATFSLATAHIEAAHGPAEVDDLDNAGRGGRAGRTVPAGRQTRQRLRGGGHLGGSRRGRRPAGVGREPCWLGARPAARRWSLTRRGGRGGCASAAVATGTARCWWCALAAGGETRALDAGRGGARRYTTSSIVFFILFYFFQFWWMSAEL